MLNVNKKIIIYLNEKFKYFCIFNKSQQIILKKVCSLKIKVIKTKLKLKLKLKQNNPNRIYSINLNPLKGKTH